MVISGTSSFFLLEMTGCWESQELHLHMAKKDIFETVPCYKAPKLQPALTSKELVLEVCAAQLHDALSI